MTDHVTVSLQWILAIANEWCKTAAPWELRFLQGCLLSPPDARDI